MDLVDGTGIWMVAMGKTIMHSLWIGLLILALLRVALLHIPLEFSNLRYRISVSALLLLLCSVIVAFIVLYEPIAPIQESLVSQGLIPPISWNLLVEANGHPGIYIHHIFIIFGYLYIAGALAMLFRSAASLGYVRRMRNSGARIGPEWQDRFSRISLSMGIRRPVDLLESARIKGPLLVGFLKPAVIVPAGMITNLPVSQIETILMHELYHLKRRDYLVNIMQLFIEGVLFYHPAVWIISGIVRNEREHCCDDGVIHKTDNPVNYAKALIHIAEQQQYTRLVPGAVGTTKHHLKFRINRILNRNTMKTNMRDRVISLALLAGSVIILLTVSGFSAGPSFVRSNNMKSEMITIPVEQAVITVADTIPQKTQEAEKEEALEELEAAHAEALKEIEEIDWEEIKEEMEAARLEALEEIEEIDWEEIKEEM
ncbi:MAG: M56 family metallopeptidase, partial [Bacteroidales bacterium]|nr:M56 family metallopeptidase [Bacteroidales bacterium]